MRKTVVPMLLIAFVLLGRVQPSMAEGEATTPAKPPAATSGTLAPDLMKLTPEDLRGADIQALARQAQTAYTEKRYEDAVRAFAELIKHRPGDAVSLYNLACCYGALGAAEPAARFLKAAWDAGYLDLEYISRDADLDPVRNTEPVLSVLEAMCSQAAGRQKYNGLPFDLIARSVQTVRVFLPDAIEPGRKYPLVVGLHGAGGTIGGFAPFFVDQARRRGMILCLPEAQYAAPGLTPGGIGYAWYKHNGPIQEPVTHALCERYVLAVIDSVLDRNKAADRDRVFLLGFSQGGFVSFSLGLKHPERFRGIVTIGAGLDPADYTRSTGNTKWPDFLVCHSPADQVVPWSFREATIDLLRENSIPFETFNYDGGHTIANPTLADTVGAWIERMARRRGR
jgi:predicted esterase